MARDRTTERAARIGARAACGAFLLAATVAAGAASADTGARPVEGEIALESRLIAPCCWTQTLDVHESPLASSLRSEIHARLGRGESTDVVEADLVERYGERLRAVPRGSDSRRAVPVIVAASMLVSALGLAWIVRRWRSRAPSASEPRAVPSSRDDYDDLLDDELRRMDA